MTLFDDYGFIGKSEIIINKNVQGYEFDTKTIGQIAKHEMDHALGLRHANFDGSVANSVRIPFGSGAFIDPLVEPSYDSTFAPINSGQPYLVPGQKIDMAIVKFNPSEQSKPIDDPFSLANNEIIATEGSVLFCPFSVIGTHCLQKGDHVVAYYVANSLKESDTFFRHGIYVLDTATRLGNAIPD